MRADEFMNENLRKWFKEKWVRFGPDGRIRGDCARGSDSKANPSACQPPKHTPWARKVVPVPQVVNADKILILNARAQPSMCPPGEKSHDTA
jgi:hypothetical protein